MMLIGLFTIFGIVNTDCPTEVFRFVNINHLLEHPVLRQASTNNVTSCGAECAGTLECQSFGYREVSSICNLYNTRVWYGMGNKTDKYFKYHIVHYWKVEDECSEGKWYVRTMNLCFRLYESERRSWIEARRFCESNGGVLFMADTSEKFQFLISFLKSNGVLGSVCVGTTDEKHPNTWNWFNGIKVVNFAAGEPQINNHCGFIYNYRYLASDSCTMECHPMCEFPTAPNAQQ